MKKYLFFLLVLAIGIVSAHASVNYQIIEDKVLVEANFGIVSNFEYLLPSDYRLL